MKRILPSEISRKYGLCNFVQCNEVDGTTPASLSLLDYGLSPTAETAFGQVITPGFNVVGDGDWIDMSAAVGNTAITVGTVPIPGTAKGCLLFFNFKSTDHPSYATGNIGLGSYASGACIAYESLSATTGRVTIRDITANEVVINTTEPNHAGVKVVFIYLDRVTDTATVFSGRGGSNTAFSAATGTGDISSLGNIVVTNLYVEDIAEFHPFLSFQYAADGHPVGGAPTADEVNTFIEHITNDGEWFGRQVRDWDRGIPLRWKGDSAVDMP